ncbi:unnamed protein product (macronuclear) [Paramecium tetraurelia]|uniref:MORN repeat protein n=1 Tax=Paramecium tetraurelia TaxID=5888 RepID=A0D4S1_PARTE|nr:uncharacterized protein GSPATT00013485001 [Paramecium tetraurelia]CAK78038.1 unnamed protein product [Paramecium tetraurelia]|eukprot:XP_001445435.1 hypothetical protein (macronuclear) [Paramecium tetraurelia strain d4-2]
MSQKSLQDFNNTYGSLIAIRNSQCLYNDQNRINIIYKLEINKSQQPQLNTSITQEIKLQNELARNIKQYLKIIEYAIEETEQNKKVYMVVQNDELNNSILYSFKEIDDKPSKIQQFKKILLLMMDLEKKKPKIFYFRKNNIFYVGNLIYLTIFGWTQDFLISNATNQNLKKLEDLTFKIAEITYLDEQGQEKQHKLTKHKLDLGIFFQQSILNIDRTQISIQDINMNCHDEDLKKIAKIIKCFIINNGSIQQMNLQLQQRNQSQQFKDKLIEEWEKFVMILQLKLMDDAQLRVGLDLSILKELSADQLDKYIQIQKGEYQSGNIQKKKRARILIFQAEQRQLALGMLNKQNKDFHPNLIYFLKENELEQLKNDKNLLKQIQIDENKINKYIDLLQKMSLCQLDQVVLDNEQLSLIPIKMLQSIQNSTIQEFCSKKEFAIKQSASKIERFDFEKALEAKDKYNKFQLTINNKSSINADSLLENQLTYQQVQLLNENTQKTYRDTIIRTIESKRNSTNKNDRTLLETLTRVLNQGFQELDHQQPLYIENFRNQLYIKQQKEGVYFRNLKFNDRNNLNFSEKVNEFFKYCFTGDILYNEKFSQYLREFQRVSISNYDGYQINGKKQGLGLRKINENHLRFGIFQLDQQIWGWEIVFQSQIISFYKGPFLNDQKDGQGIQQKCKFQDEKVLIEEYVGGFQKDKKNGTGELNIYNNSQLTTVIKGDFKDDQVHGIATISQNGQIIFFGQFKNGKKNGQGEEIQDQTRITGCYLDDKKTGIHITKRPDGTTETNDYGSPACSVF